MYLYLGRGTEMAYSDSCYSSPAGSLSSIPGIAPRQHLAHSSSQQFFRTFAPGKKKDKRILIINVLCAYQLQQWSNSHFSFNFGFTATCQWIENNLMVENYSDIFLFLVSIPQIIHILNIILSNVMKRPKRFFVFNEPLQLN